MRTTSSRVWLGALLLACAAVSLLPTGCRQADFGPKLSARQSSQVSALAAEQISAQYQVAPESSPNSQAAASAFDTLSRHAGALPSGVDLRFYVLDTPEQFAISLPDGHLYIASGLLDLIASDRGECAALIAHQIGHIEGGHDAANLTSALGQNDLVNMLDQGKYQDVVNTELELQRLSYTNEQEYQADRYAVHLLAVSGYDPSDLWRLVTLLSENHSSTEAESWSESHPVSKSRVSRIKDAIAALGH